MDLGRYGLHQGWGNNSALEDYGYDDYDYRSSASHHSKEDSRERDYDYGRHSYDSDYERGRNFGRATDRLHPDDLDADLLFDDAYLRTRRNHTDVHRPLPRRQPTLSSWDRPSHEIEDNDPFRHRARWDAPTRRDLGVPLQTDLPGVFTHYQGPDSVPRKGAFVGTNRRVFGRTQPQFQAEDRRSRPTPQLSFSSWDRPFARLQLEVDDYEEPRHHTSWAAPSRRESRMEFHLAASHEAPQAQSLHTRWREPHLSADDSSSSVYASTSPDMVTRKIVPCPTQPIHVSAAERAERAKMGLCFYCPDKWERGHECQTKLLDYYGEDDSDEQQGDDDRAIDEETDDAQPEPRKAAEAGVIAVHELQVAAETHAIKAEVPDAEAERHGEPVVEVLKPAAQPCLIAASFAFVSLSHELLQKLPNSGKVGCGIEGKHLECSFILVGSMERIWRVIDSLGFRLHVARCVFDPGGNVSSQSALCSTSPRCAWFIATWYPP